MALECSGTQHALRIRVGFCRPLQRQLPARVYQKRSTGFPTYKFEVGINFTRVCGVEKIVVLPFYLQHSYHLLFVGNFYITCAIFQRTDRKSMVIFSAVSVSSRMKYQG
ncbi:MAG: hypothetical protein ACHBN1_00530 [Heteroscytonema crispum UTEX LB 1556]